MSDACAKLTSGSAWALTAVQACLISALCLLVYRFAVRKRAHDHAAQGDDSGNPPNARCSDRFGGIILILTVVQSMLSLIDCLMVTIYLWQVNANEEKRKNNVISFIGFLCEGAVFGCFQMLILWRIHTSFSGSVYALSQRRLHIYRTMLCVGWVLVGLSISLWYWANQISQTLFLIITLIVWLLILVSSIMLAHELFSRLHAIVKTSEVTNVRSVSASDTSNAANAEKENSDILCIIKQQTLSDVLTHNRDIVRVSAKLNVVYLSMLLVWVVCCGTNTSHWLQA